MIGTLFLGTALAGLAACDQQPEPMTDFGATVDIETASASAPSPFEAASESPTDTDVETVPVASVPATQRKPTGPAIARPSRTPTTGSTPTPAPTTSDVAEPADPHAGHNMESMSDHDMEVM
jgi:hypothetical protein